MTLQIGDTPEQLGSCLTADAIMIDGKIVTKQQIEELIAIQTRKLAGQLSKLVEMGGRIADLEQQNQQLMSQTSEAFGDGYYDGFLDGAKHHEDTDCNTKPDYLGDHAMRCSEIAEDAKSKRLGILSRQELVAQVDVLTAHGSALATAASMATGALSAGSPVTEFCIESVKRFNAAKEATPAECLAHVKASGVDSLKFPTMLRKMWSGGEVQEWLEQQAERIRNGGTE